jgi:ABC-type Na+ efflux pump permease subunit
MQPVLDEYLQRTRYGREFSNSAPPLEEVRRIFRPVHVASAGLIRKNARTGDLEPAAAEDRVTAVLVPALMMALMFMMVIIGASPLLQSVVEEKTLRIAEVLLGSVTPWQLMLGKLLGTVGVSLTLGLVYLAGGLWAATHFGFSERISSGMLGFFLAFQVLAVLMYGSIFIAIGAACSDLRETQSMLLPVMFVLVLPMFVLGYVIQFPNSPIATALSFFPTATPMMMTIRQGIPPGIPLWQSLVGMAVVILTTVVFVWAAGRIFRVGILMQGKGARIGEMLRWVVRG